jgi:hypothetical protein
VQAPQRRVEHRDAGRSRMWFLALAGAILIAAVAVGLAMAFRGGGGGAVANGADGPCVRQTFSPMGRQHVQSLRSGFQYNSFPPTSGPHYGVPAVYNIYDQPVPEIRLVHNLEHGAVVVQYGSKVPNATVQKLVAWYSKSPLGLVVAPLPPVSEMNAKAPPGYESKIFLTAWTHVATCSAFDEGVFDRFRDDYRGPTGDGPEKFPLSSLQPGGT